MASPMIAGIASLLRTYRPDLSATAIRDAIYNGASNLPAFAGKIVNNRRANLYNSFKLLDNKPPIFTEINIDTSAYCLNNIITYTVTGIDDIALTGSAYSFDGTTRQIS